jgi:hypothetical protein
MKSNFICNNFFIPGNILPQVFLGFNLKSIFIILLRILIFLIIVLALGIYNAEVISADEGVSVLELDGWSKAPEPNLKDLPYDVIILFLFTNLFAFYSLIPLGIPGYSEIGVQTDTLFEISKILGSISDSVSEADISFYSLSTALSNIPSIPNTADIYPTLARNTDLNHAFRAQEIYTELLNVVDPNVPHFEVYKTILSFAKRIFYNALCQGLVPGTTEFSQYLNETLLNNRPLVNYLAQNGVNVLDLID